MSRNGIRVMICVTEIVLVALLTGCFVNRGQQDTQSQDAQRRQLPVALASKMVRVSDLPVLGNADATLALIEVTDYQCPFCQAHYHDTFPRLKREFIDAGRINYYILDYPLRTHEFASQVAVAASCAGEQQSYWPYRDALFEHSGMHTDSVLIALADDLDLDLRKFEDCLESGRYQLTIDRRRAVALGLGIQGTPTFLLGRLSGARTVTDIAVLPGLQTMDGFRDVIRRYEDSQKAGVAPAAMTSQGRSL